MRPNIKKAILVLEALDRGLELKLEVTPSTPYTFMMDDKKFLYFKMTSVNGDTGLRSVRWLEFTPSLEGFFAMCTRLSDDDIRVIEANLILNDP